MADFSERADPAPLVYTQHTAEPSGVSDETWLVGTIQSTAIFLSQLAPWLTAAWFCGVLVSSCKLVRGFWWVNAISRKQVEPVSPELLERLKEMRGRLSISRPVRLLRSAMVEVPTVVGWLRPVILLPGSSLVGLTPYQMEAILVHELAHIRRFDYVVNACQCLVETLMFYHPVVWWVSRCVREEREHCCDDLVVKVCGNRVAYARALASLEEKRGEMPQLAFAASGGSLLNRVRRLLGVAGAEESMGLRQIGGLALLGVGLVFILMGAYLILQTPMYRATARIKVEHDASLQVGSENGKFTLTAWDPYFVQNVCEEIYSEPVLNKVVNDLRLGNEWTKKFNHELAKSPHEIITLLRGRIGCQPLRNTTFLEISCISEKPDDAKAIANAVAEAYRNFRFEEFKRTSLGGLNALEDRLKEQEEQVRKTQFEVDRLREQLNIPEAVGSDNAPAMWMTAETLRRLEGMRIELEAKVMQDETLLVALKKMSRDKLVYALPTAAPDQMLNVLLNEKTVCEQSLISKRQENGEQHPDVVRLKNQLEDIKIKINEQMDGILLGIETRWNSESEQLKKLKDEVEKAKANDIANAKRAQPYWEAKRKLDEQQRFSQVLTMKIASERIEAALPKKALVEIMSLAEAPRRASYPNRPKAAALIVLGILLDLAGFRMTKARPRLTPVLQPASEPV
jgi:beta-lactamase regulating signal transducer with metallopeptidase domain